MERYPVMFCGAVILLVLLRIPSLLPDLEVYLQQIYVDTQTVEHRLQAQGSAVWDEDDYLVTDYFLFFPDSVVLTGEYSKFDKGWNIIGSGGGMGGTIAYGLYKYSNDNCSNYWYIDWRDDSLQYGVGIDIILRFDGDILALNARGTNQSPEPDWQTFYGGDTIHVWNLKRGQYVGAFRETFQPTTPTSLAVTVENSHPKLSWTRSEPTESAKYDVYRATSEGGAYSKVNEAPITANYWVDGEIWTNFYPQRTWYYKVKAMSEDESKYSPGYSNIVSIDGKWIPQKRNVTDGFDSPTAWSLSAFPNPLNPATHISYSLAEEGFVKVQVFDLQGRCIADVVNGFALAGNHQAIWHASGVESGTYFVSLSVTRDNGAITFRTARKVTVLK